MRTFFLLIAAGLFFYESLLAQHTPVVPVDSIRDDAILFPESMTEQLSDLLGAWQLDLKDVEVDCSMGQNVLFHDSIYTQRLHSMPSEMELSYNSVVKKYIDMYADRKREQVSYMLALGDYYFPMFEQALDAHGLPLELKYLPVIESALNPVAVSRAGATGLWQFMLRTGKGYGLEVNSLVDERRDPYKSTEAAVRYLKDLYAIYEDWNLVIAAYNCGPGNVNKAIARSGGKRDYWQIYSRLPRETRGYVPAFIAANYIMNHYADHNICPVHPYNTSVSLDTVQIHERIHLEQIAAVLDIPMSELRRLNPQFKKDVIPGDFKAYSLVLPSEKVYAFIDNAVEINEYKRNEYLTHRRNTEGYLDGTAFLNSGNAINVYYKVKNGDNLSTIARKHGISLSQLMSWNGLKSSKIGIGKMLIVGFKEAQKTDEKQSSPVLREELASNGTVNLYYRVKKGDTLSKIAKEVGVTVSQIQSWNDLQSTHLSVGDQLIVGLKEVVEPDKSELDVSAETTENYSEESLEEESKTVSNLIEDQNEKIQEGNSLEEIDGKLEMN